MAGPRELLRLARLYRSKTIFMVGNRRPWVRARIHWEFMRRMAHVSWPLYGPVLPALRDGRFDLAPHVTIMTNCWFTMPGDATLKIGEGTWINMGVMIAAYERVEIGRFCLFANGCFISDADHRFDDPDKPVFQQGYKVKGATVIGDHVWCGINVAITGGVTIGDHCVIGANSVVTHDLPPFSVAAGAPARVIRKIEHDTAQLT